MRLIGRLRAACLPVLLAGSVAVAAADDDYLKLLDEEVAKVDGAATDGVVEAAAATNGRVSERTSASRQHFEDLLREQHVGTYSFYRRLPERNRQEIFLDYQAGMPMDQLRDKVVARFLHP
jgi:predicted 2-oxoglutarate/Fe(II)-dependent dioxygenase YbiX